MFQTLSPNLFSGPSMRFYMCMYSVRVCGFKYLMYTYLLSRFLITLFLKGPNIYYLLQVFLFFLQTMTDILNKFF